MRELSLHILDIAENGITAGADCIHILVHEARIEDMLTIKIKDNGRGMPADKLKKLTDPFVTSRTTRRVGLGLSLMATAADRCDGKLVVETEAGVGTEVVATFRHSHIDRAPLGDMASTISTLIMGNPQTDFVYTHIIDDDDFILDTRELKQELDDNALTNPVVIHSLTESIRHSIEKMASSNDQSEAKENSHGKIDDRRS
ncbi:MAG: ATP-binding protein [Deltaproteobacteria bacterium]|nr:ATP-binding protein [Deltaproteobacteria bacterium]